MNALNAPVFNFINRIALRAKRADTLRYLLARSDHELADIGVSRALLADGVQAWPWRDAALGGSRPDQADGSDNLPGSGRRSAPLLVARAPVAVSA